MRRNSKNIWRLFSILSFTILVCHCQMLSRHTAGGNSEVSTSVLDDRSKKQAQEIFRVACRDTSEQDIEELTKSGSEFAAQLCECLSDNLPHGKDLCLKSQLKIAPQLTEFYQSEFTTPIEIKLKNLNVQNANICAQQKVTQKSQDLLMLKLNAACTAGKAQALETILTQWKDLDPKSCWRYRRIDVDGCIVAEPCTREGANLDALSLKGSHSGIHRGSVRLCNKALSSIHRIKDPLGTTVPLSDPLAYFATSTYFPTGEYGFPNCHGTALALQNGYLNDLPLQGVAFRNSGPHSPACEHKAAELRAELKAAQKSIGDMIGRTKGVGISLMTYDHCGPDDCGTANLHFDQCDANESQLFVDVRGLCVTCWEKQIAAHGIHKFSNAEGPDRLRPGCFMNVADHTTTVVGRFGNMCYTYEATTPWGPPILSVNTCLGLWSSFDRHYCPKDPLQFTLVAPNMKVSTH